MALTLQHDGGTSVVVRYQRLAAMPPTASRMPNGFHFGPRPAARVEMTLDPPAELRSGSICQITDEHGTSVDLVIETSGPPVHAMTNADDLDALQP